jgi:phosphoketolase
VRGDASSAGREDADEVDAHWRAANYVSVGHIYLYDNFLLKRRLAKEHIDPPARPLKHHARPELRFCPSEPCHKEA